MSLLKDQRVILLSFLLCLATVSCNPTKSSTEASLSASTVNCARSARYPNPGEVPTRDMIMNTAKVTEQEIAAVNKYTNDSLYSGLIKEMLQCSQKSDVDDLCIFGESLFEYAAEFRSAVNKISSTMAYKGLVFRSILVSRETANKMKSFVGKTMGLAQGGKTAFLSSTRSLQFAKTWVDNLEKRQFGQMKKILYMIHQCSGASIEAIEPAIRGAKSARDNPATVSV